MKSLEIKVLVGDERRIGAGADRAFGVRLVTGCADVSEQVSPALLAEFPAPAQSRAWRRSVTG